MENILSFTVLKTLFLKLVKTCKNEFHFFTSKISILSFLKSPSKEQSKAQIFTN